MSEPDLMQGFPPTPETQVTLANWRTAPYSRWAFHHVREIVASADIPNDPDAVFALPPEPADLDRLMVDGVALGSILDTTETDESSFCITADWCSRPMRTEWTRSRRTFSCRCRNRSWA